MEKLTEYLKATGTTQSDFAALIGVDQSVVSRYLSKEAKPTIDRAVQIARLTNNAVPVEAWAS